MLVHDPIENYRHQDLFYTYPIDDEGIFLAASRSSTASAPSQLGRLQASGLSRRNTRQIGQRRPTALGSSRLDSTLSDAAVLQYSSTLEVVDF